MSSARRLEHETLHQQQYHPWRFDGRGRNTGNQTWQEDCVGERTSEQQGRVHP
jgi:hypothetical protein